MRILCVEDDSDCHYLMTMVLGIAGHSAVTYRCPVEALEWYQEHPDEIDGALLDFMMPRMSGGTLAARLRENGMKGPIFIITGNRAVTMELVKEHGVDAVYHKPTKYYDIFEELEKQYSQMK